jgi:hypothetical protein
VIDLNTKLANARQKKLTLPEPSDNDGEQTQKQEPAKWPSPLAPEARHGLVGEFVSVIEPHTETDSVALLVSFLLAIGNAVGRTAYAVADGSHHYCNEFAVLVGQSSKSRKGTSWNRTKDVLELAAEDWATRRVLSGLSSGEGLIYNVRDAVVQNDEVTDPGEPDKRLMLVESEFASVLKQTERLGNTLSTVVRDAWDKSRLSPLTKNNRIVATEPHISILGHITREETSRYLSATEIANGFGNRFLWFLVTRSKLLPLGGMPKQSELESIAEAVGKVLKFGESAGQMHLTPEAREAWYGVYPKLSRDRYGLSGSLTARAEAHVWRLALMYAVIDRAKSIGTEHLAAAIALWEYSEEAVNCIFGDATGNPLADDLIRLIRANPLGVSRTDLSGFLGRNVSADKIGQALGLLLKAGLARPIEQKTDGRPKEVWQAIQRGGYHG